MSCKNVLIPCWFLREARTYKALVLVTQLDMHYRKTLYKSILLTHFEAKMFFFFFAMKVGAKRAPRARKGMFSISDWNGKLNWLQAWEQFTCFPVLTVEVIKLTWVNMPVTSVLFHFENKRNWRSLSKGLLQEKGVFTEKLLQPKHPRTLFLILQLTPFPVIQ